MPSRVSLDPYTLLGLSGRYRVNPQVTLLGRVENMIDDDYQDVLGFATEGLSAYVGIKLETAR